MPTASDFLNDQPGWRYAKSIADSQYGYVTTETAMLTGVTESMIVSAIEVGAVQRIQHRDHFFSDEPSRIIADFLYLSNTSPHPFPDMYQRALILHGTSKDGKLFLGDHSAVSHSSALIVHLASKDMNEHFRSGNICYEFSFPDDGYHYSLVAPTDCRKHINEMSDRDIIDVHGMMITSSARTFADLVWQSISAPAPNDPCYQINDWDFDFVGSLATLIYRGSLTVEQLTSAFISDKRIGGNPRDRLRPLTNQICNTGYSATLSEEYLDEIRSAVDAAGPDPVKFARALGSVIPSAPVERAEPPGKSPRSVSARLRSIADSSFFRRAELRAVRPSPGARRPRNPRRGHSR